MLRLVKHTLNFFGSLEEVTTNIPPAVTMLLHHSFASSFFRFTNQKIKLFMIFYCKGGAVVHFA